MWDENRYILEILAGYYLCKTFQFMNCNAIRAILLVRSMRLAYLYMETGALASVRKAHGSGEEGVQRPLPA